MVFRDNCFLVNFMCFLPVSNIALAALVGSAVIVDKTLRWAAADFFMILDYLLPLSTKLNKVEFDIY